MLEQVREQGLVGGAAAWAGVVAPALGERRQGARGVDGGLAGVDRREREVDDELVGGTAPVGVVAPPKALPNARQPASTCSMRDDATASPRSRNSRSDAEYWPCPASR
ncbi:hypothetical protein [Nocardia asteroides]|uniref:hypothetical protein n=1 Tax=Nocardia asteroides TaxID=1824 RepID=UPI0036533C99